MVANYFLQSVSGCPDLTKVTKGNNSWEMSSWYMALFCKKQGTAFSILPSLVSGIYTNFELSQPGIGIPWYS